MKTLGRPRSLPPALVDYDFARLAKKEKNARLKIRFLALFQVQTGKTYQAISALLHIHPYVIGRWVKRLEKEGLKGLEEKPGRGRKRHLNKAQEPAFVEAVTVLGQQRTGGRSRAKDIQGLLHEKFKASYALSSVYYVLHRAGMAWITARAKHPHSSLEAQESFKKTLLNT